MLTVYHVWKVHNLMHQISATKRRKKVAEDLYTMEDEPEERVVPSADKYLSLLHTYLLAMATAGVGKAGVPREELPGSDSWECIIAPWDVLEMYYLRALRAAKNTRNTSDWNGW